MDKHDIERRISPLMEHDETVEWIGASPATAYLLGRIPHFVIVVGFISMPFVFSRKSVDTFLTGGLSALHLFMALWIGLLIFPLYGTARDMVRDTSVRWAITNRRIYRITRSSVTTTEIPKVTSLELRGRRGDRGTLIAYLPEYRDDDNHLHRPSVHLVSVIDVNGAHAAISAGMKTPPS